MLRVDEAKALMLEHPETGYSEIANLVGYSSQHELTVAFSLSTGCTPAYWKRKHSPRDPGPAKSEARKSSETGGSPKRPEKAIPFDVAPITQWKRQKGFCRKNLSQADVARELGFSELRFSQYLKQVPQVPFKSWISDLRMEEAKRVLVTRPSLTIRQVAESVGIVQIKHFRECFRRAAGMSPIRWRLENALDDQDSGPAVPAEKRNPVPVALNLERLKEIQEETMQSQAILATIFKDEEDSPSATATQQDAAAPVASILGTLFEKERWMRSEFDGLCSAHKLLPGYVMELINDMAFEKVGDIVLEEDGDALYVTTEYKGSF